MEFFVPDNKRVCFRQIPPEWAEHLRQVLDYLSTPSEKTEARLFPQPSSDESVPGLKADWKAYVEPEIHDQFRSDRETVALDLRSIASAEDGIELSIPENHIDAWLSTANQARLALEEDFSVNAFDLDSLQSGDVPEETARALLWYDVLTFMQECLVQHLE